MRGVALIAVAASIAACSAFSSGEGGESSPGDAGTDGPSSASAEGGSPADAGGGADAGATNLLVNGDFELSGCGGWTVNNALASPTTTAHGGSGACRICRTGVTASYFGPETSKLLQLRPGTYTFEIWVRADLDAGAPSSVTAQAYVVYPDSGTSDGMYSSPQLVDASWRKISHVFTLPDDTQATLHVALQATDGECFLIDDAALYGP